MAYSDYGGYAYRNGERVEERSDAVLTSEGIKSTCGQWPGFTIPEARDGRGECFHTLLGDGPVLIGMYKQSHISVYRDGQVIDLLGLFKDRYPVTWTSNEGKECFDEERVRGNTVIEAKIKECELSLYFEETDNFYVHAKLIQPDGSIWTGWSGYGVGAGLEDCGYGFNQSDVEARSFDLWGK